MRRLWENYTSLKIEKKKENPPRAGEVVLITAEGCVVPKICFIINNDRLFQLIWCSLCVKHTHTQTRRRYSGLGNLMITIFVSLEKIALSCERELQKQQHIYLLENDSAQCDLRQQVGWFEMRGWHQLRWWWWWWKHEIIKPTCSITCQRYCCFFLCHQEMGRMGNIKEGWPGSRTWWVEFV